MSETSIRVKLWRKQTKIKIVESMGGKCCICGYNKCNWALALHHLNPIEKDFTISEALASPRSWNKIVLELRKCILVCHNCHSEIHANPSTPIENVVRFNEKYSYVKFSKKINNFIFKRKEKNLCVECKKEIVHQAIRCTPCYSISRRKVVRPNKEELIKLVWSVPSVKIAKMFGISAKAVEKWCKFEKISKPPRGYWAKIKFVSTK
jgi:hypothetical protein